MKNGFSQQEKEFFLRQKSGTSKIRTVVVIILFLLIYGLLIDTLNGFFILGNERSFAWHIAGLILLALFSLVVEAGVEWVASKDDVSHPLNKRIFHLFMLLGIVGGIAAFAILP